MKIKDNVKISRIACVICAGMLMIASSGCSKQTEGFSGKLVLPVQNADMLDEDKLFEGHTGLDFIAGKGTEIAAAADGIVLEADCDKDGIGNYITIDHGDGYKTLYAYCDSLAVASGDKVCAGDIIATVGSSGITTANHLHFELTLDGNPIDAQPFIA